MSNAEMLDLNPKVAIKSESPLALSRPTAKLSSAQNAGVVVTERQFLGHLILRGNVADAAFCQGVENALGVSLPIKFGPISIDEANGVSIQWMSPDEWLIIVPGGREYEAEVALRDRLEGHFAVMNVSGGQTVLELSGPSAREVLMKSTHYDVHPDHFPVGKGVSTVFTKGAAIIRRVAEDRWELVIRRSFADYLYRWILDASEEFGVFVAPPESGARGA